MEYVPEGQATMNREKKRFLKIMKMTWKTKVSIKLLLILKQKAQRCASISLYEKYYLTLSKWFIYKVLEIVNYDIKNFVFYRQKLKNKGKCAR